jgi:hypothetical protein
LLALQVISEIQLAMNQAQKIQTTPFPFPFVQVRGDVKAYSPLTR